MVDQRSGSENQRGCRSRPFVADPVCRGGYRAAIAVEMDALHPPHDAEDGYARRRKKIRWFVMPPSVCPRSSVEPRSPEGGERKKTVLRFHSERSGVLQAGQSHSRWEC